MIDASTETWRDIAAKLNDIIENGRTRLEANDQNYGESQFIRGRISACREIIALVRPAVVLGPKKTHDLKPRDRSGV